jgi:hypothetical protein
MTTTALAIVCGSIILAVGFALMSCFLFWERRAADIYDDEDREFDWYDDSEALGLLAEQQRKEREDG